MSSYCALPADPITCLRLIGVAPSACLYVSCSQLCQGSTATGLTVDPSTSYMYVVWNDPSSIGNVILQIKPAKCTGGAAQERRVTLI